MSWLKLWCRSPPNDRIDALKEVLGRIDGSVIQLLALSRASRTEQEQIQMDVQLLAEKVTALTTIDQGLTMAVAAIIAQETQIAASLKTAIANGSDPVKIQAIADALDANIAQLTTNQTNLVDAVTANTTPPVEAPVPPVAMAERPSGAGPAESYPVYKSDTVK